MPDFGLQIHEDFKEMVESLLSGFLEELGVGETEFYDAINQSEPDSLGSFVAQTVLTVDDFMMFKTMMVKRNTQLTNQVCQELFEGGAGRPGAEPQHHHT